VKKGDKFCANVPFMRAKTIGKLYSDKAGPLIISDTRHAILDKDRRRIGAALGLDRGDF